MHISNRCPQYDVVIGVAEGRIVAKQPLVESACGGLPQ
jgi:hypothetical protein